jgi:hypothetical protein
MLARCIHRLSAPTQAGVRSLHASGAALARILCVGEWRHVLAGSVRHCDGLTAADNVSPVCAQVLQDGGHHVVEVKGALSNAELKTTLPEFDSIVVRSGTFLTADVFPACPNLKVCMRLGLYAHPATDWRADCWPCGRGRGQH